MNESISPFLTQLLEMSQQALTSAGRSLAHVLLSPGSVFSIASLLFALNLAVVFLAAKRSARHRPVRLKVILRALFPKRLLLSRSTKADLGFMLFNTMLFGAMFGWALLSFRYVTDASSGVLVDLFGAASPTTLPETLCIAMITVVVFLAYDLGYWLDHYLSHRVAFLWEFHKVHHTATVLSPMTAFRVHPVDTIVFQNILAITTGTAHGVLIYLLGRPIDGLSVFGTNIVLLAFVFMVIHFQHSHLWIAFTGVWGRIFLSPAHHQIHHSDNPVHFNRNLGSCLSIWDWLFGTLHIPSAVRERLTFGVTPRAESQNTVTGGLLAPFAHAAMTVAEPLRDRRELRRPI